MNCLCKNTDRNWGWVYDSFAIFETVTSRYASFRYSLHACRIRKAKDPITTSKIWSPCLLNRDWHLCHENMRMARAGGHLDSRITGRFSQFANTCKDFAMHINIIIINRLWYSQVNIQEKSGICILQANKGSLVRVNGEPSVYPLLRSLD